MRVEVGQEEAERRELVGRPVDHARGRPPVVRREAAGILEELDPARDVSEDHGERRPDETDGDG
jgi:hypothetical protein